MSQHIYIENQKILCYHGDFLYEGKILKVSRDITKNADLEQQATISYFIHYNGWNKTWDEWVPSSRLMPLTQDNLLKQKQLFRDYERKNQLGDKVKLKKKKVCVSTLQDLDSDVGQSNVQSSLYSIQSKPKTYIDQSVGILGISNSTVADSNENHSPISCELHHFTQFYIHNIYQR